MLFCNHCIINRKTKTDRYAPACSYLRNSLNQRLHILTNTMTPFTTCVSSVFSRNRKQKTLIKLKTYFWLHAALRRTVRRSIARADRAFCFWFTLAIFWCHEAIRLRSMKSRKQRTVETILKHNTVNEDNVCKMFCTLFVWNFWKKYILTVQLHLTELAWNWQDTNRLHDCTVLFCCKLI